MLDYIQTVSFVKKYIALKTGLPCFYEQEEEDNASKLFSVFYLNTKTKDSYQYNFVLDMHIYAINSNIIKHEELISTIYNAFNYKALDINGSFLKINNIERGGINEKEENIDLRRVDLVIEGVIIT